MDFMNLVATAYHSKASDIHIATGNLPAYRVHGKINYMMEEDVLTESDVLKAVQQVLDPKAYDEYMETGDVDAAKSIEGFGRFRINVFHQRNGTALVMRLINENAPELDTLNLPNSIRKVLSLQEGLVLVTGPTGSGKSTTLAAIINEINKNHYLHILTIEDPVEYLHKPRNCIINQREVGEDSKTYSAALRAALREDPDVILMGEIRDYESMSIALTAAETGHLVFSTLHTEGAAKSIDRLIDMYPTDRQQQALGQLSTTLKAVISQRLLPRCDKPGRIGAFEIMFVTSSIANLIRENKIAQIEQMIQISQSLGMITKKKSVENLLASGIISKETADRYTYDVKDQDLGSAAGGNMPLAGMPASMSGTFQGGGVPYGVQGRGANTPNSKYGYTPNK